MQLRAITVLAVLPLALLAGCKDKPATGNDARAATGEVLPGSVSDAMLPVDTVRSQPPLAGPEAGGTSASKTAATPVANASETPAAAEMPAATPTPQASAT